MRFNIYSQDKIDFPEICSNCLNETGKKIHMDVEKQESMGMVFIDLIFPFTALRHVGSSVTIPFCSYCLNKIIGIRLFVLFVFMISVLLVVYGINDKMSDLGMYSTVGGIFLGIFCPFLYLMLKENGIGVLVVKNDQGYCYSFNSDYYLEYLKGKGYIVDYETVEES